ncbi:MAG TPA: triose-phosphate isomerase [Candidatus Bathyarchaeota archaeon]|nr:MAG: triose-phosphate isomerase [Candidatus Bathyarchaeota archaeon]HDJ25967.1 triose-phosphate isomerase [Candidatus Bathyarchaeota archaeon]
MRGACEITRPLILVNFKVFPEAIGRRAVEKARIAEAVSQEFGVCVIVAPSLVDIAPVAEEVSIPVFAQHVDPVEPGARTGHVPPHLVKEAGATGAMLNHAEKRMSFLEALSDALNLCRKVGLKTLVCCAKILACRLVVRLGPDMFAFEPPELIGTGKSVSSERPDTLRRAMERAKSVNPKVFALCGAGVSCGKDVYDAIMLGAEGVLVGSVVRRPNFKEVLSEMAKSALEAWERREEGA